jgi:hypothetical protein
VPPAAPARVFGHTTYRQMSSEVRRSRTRPSRGSYAARVIGYPNDDDWYPHKPTVAQVLVGVVFFVAVAGISLFWASEEPDRGNRVFLWSLAGLALLFAVWRMAIGIRLARENLRRRRALRG